MSISRDIVRTYRAPRQVLRSRVGDRPREDRALAVLMGACFLVFVASWPYQARLAHEDPSVPLQARLGASLMAWLFIVPLGAYVLAAITHAAARIIGGRASWFEARMALFWALLAASPLWLLNGLVAGFIGPGPGLTLVGAVAMGAFLVFWGAGLWEVETKRA